MDYLLNIVQDMSFENIIYDLFGYICHQDKSILLRVGDNLIPLCPRCLGLHTGFFLSLLFFKLFFQKPININKPFNFFIIISSISIAGMHWLLGFLGIVEMNLTFRLLTGLVSGSGFFVLLNSLKYKYNQSEFDIPVKEKIIFASILVSLLCINLTGKYNLLILSILVLVSINIISIIKFLWQIIRHNKNYYHSFLIKKEIKL